MSATTGSQVPNTTFTYIPWAPELDSGKVCGVPTSFQAHDRWKGKKVVVVSIPGAFTPVCHQNHIPGFISKINDLKAKGVDEVVVIAVNDAFVMSGWGVNLGGKDQIVYACDNDVAFSKALGATLDLTSKGMGVRTARYALVLDDLKISYFGLDEGNMGAPEKSSVDTVLAQL
ncbi:peroxiredoxin type-2 [Malassezia equina]|uniref:Putative peroxiredoxin n=1 Tax=Malassezia equina TaxID=1381935 RepID=A0AAF0IZE6_9BASI|nr:peroxiredoxin type-2 [Malassezia equina]